MIAARPIWCSFCRQTAIEICDDAYTCKQKRAQREQADPMHEDPLAAARGILRGLLLSLPLCALLAWVLWTLLGVLGWR